MEIDPKESMKFVLLIEEHKDVLLISQAVDQKQKKTDAVSKILPKWTEISGKTLTQASLFKKINNFKSRAKTILNSGKTLSDWQAKLLQIVGANIETDVGADDGLEVTNSTSSVTVSNVITGDTSSSNNVGKSTVSNVITGDTSSSNNVGKSKTTAEKVLDKYETDETKSLNNDQLHRFVLLKQVKVLTMQEQRLERLESITHIENSTDIAIDYVDWEETNQFQNL